MQIKVTELGTIEYSIRKGNGATRHALAVVGAEAAVDFSGDGFRDGAVGVNIAIPLNTTATRTIDGAEITLTAREVLGFLRSLARPVAKAEALRQVNTEQVSMPTDDA